MSEKQIRDILRDVCADLDRHSRQVVRQGVRKIVLPTVLGAGLALSPGCGDDAVKQDTTVQQDGGLLYMGPDAGPPDTGPDPKKDGALDGPGTDGVGTPDMAYMGPDAGKADAGPIPPYMAPEGGTLYMGPDAGPMPPDGLPVPPYMAPDGAPKPPPDGGPMPPYMAPPDKGPPPPPPPPPPEKDKP